MTADFKESRRQRYEKLLRDLTDGELYILLYSLERAEIESDGQLNEDIRDDAEILHAIVYREYNERELHWSLFSDGEES